MGKRISGKGTTKKTSGISYFELEKIAEDYLKSPSEGKWQVLENCMRKFHLSAGKRELKWLMRLRLMIYQQSEASEHRVISDRE